VTLTPPELAQGLFAPLSPGYERWAVILGMGQDGRWRRRMVEGLGLGSDSDVLDVAAGTGSITRLLQEQGAQVISLDQSLQMLMAATARGATAVVATAERLPFRDARFDAVTFGYLLRYVDDIEGCLRELARVTRPGGRVGMVEFSRPTGLWRPLWWLYTRAILPLLGLVAGTGWYRVGRFLGPSIEDFADRYPPPALTRIWEDAGFRDVETTSMSLGGGLVMWGVRRG
jgi:demethylmenaquinone methyltransferase/2-methoxy-6-polyprenyl-1,4-benzoquinol methylase